MRDIVITIPTINRSTYLLTLASVTLLDGLDKVEELKVVTLPPKEKDYVNSVTAKHLYSILNYYGVKVKIEVQQSKGIGKARAFQLKGCEGKKVLFIDDDMIVSHNILDLEKDLTDDIVAVMPKILSNYDPDGLMGKTFITMNDKLPPNWINDKKAKILLPFYNESIKTVFNVLYFMTAMVDLTKLKPGEIRCINETLKKWRPDKGYEDRWVGTYLMKRGYKILFDGNYTTYHIFDKSELRCWETEIDYDEELNLLSKLAENPFIEEVK